MHVICMSYITVRGVLNRVLKPIHKQNSRFVPCIYRGHSVHLWRECLYLSQGWYESVHVPT